jgi:hypothetical protein
MASSAVNGANTTMKCTKRTWLGRPLTVVIAFLPLAVKFQPECTTDS